MDRLILAPLHGITSRIFRAAYVSHFRGIDAALSPFILSVDPASCKASYFKDLIPADEPGTTTDFLIPQILSNDAPSFLATARLLADRGYREVNWNLGCPYPMVAKKGRGSGLLPHPDRIAAFLDAVCPAAPLPLSVKLRLGRYDSREIDALIPLLNDHPLASVTLHPRIGKQLYRGTVDLEAFAAALPRIRHPLTYNGDIFAEGDYLALKARFPEIRSWMLGRGILRDPFLPARIRGKRIDESEERETLRAFHDELYARYRAALHGPRHVLDKMKELWSYLKHRSPGRERDILRILRAAGLEDYERAVRLFLDL